MRLGSGSDVRACSSTHSRSFRSRALSCGLSCADSLASRRSCTLCTPMRRRFSAAVRPMPLSSFTSVGSEDADSCGRMLGARSLSERRLCTSNMALLIMRQSHARPSGCLVVGPSTTCTPRRNISPFDVLGCRRMFSCSIHTPGLPGTATMVASARGVLSRPAFSLWYVAGVHSSHAKVASAPSAPPSSFSRYGPIRLTSSFSPGGGSVSTSPVSASSSRTCTICPHCVRTWCPAEFFFPAFSGPGGPRFPTQYAEA
mmetsp:Transcript_13371/g.25665  ORF Transcript_13371/g.25665 Transcript_13371/m.25665 type:complete len:257 (+) Transcript_13371:1278-2048(+)